MSYTLQRISAVPSSTCFTEAGVQSPLEFGKTADLVLFPVTKETFWTCLPT